MSSRGGRGMAASALLALAVIYGSAAFAKLIPKVTWTKIHISAAQNTRRYGSKRWHNQANVQQ